MPSRWTRLSVKRLPDSEVRLQRHATAFNLANSLRYIKLTAVTADWSLTGF